MIMYDSVLQTPDNNGRGSLSFTFEANTIVTLEIISKFIQEFYDKVLLLTKSTLELQILVKYFDGRINSLTPIQHVNKYVPLSVLVDIINCFWANRTALLEGKVNDIVISLIDLGSAPIRLCPPTPDQPTMILSTHNRVTPILFFKARCGYIKLFREFTCIYYSFFNGFYSFYRFFNRFFTSYYRIHRFGSN